MKDFSQIANILSTNGVGFIKCFFRSNLASFYLDKDNEHLKDTDRTQREWKLDFSDGISYLGSLTTKASEIQSINFFVDGRAEGNVLVPNDPSYNFSDVVDVLLYFTVGTYQGECLIRVKGV